MRSFRSVRLAADVPLATAINSTPPQNLASHVKTLTMASMTTGQAIVASLLRHGVDTVFGIPGAHTYDLMDALHGAGERLRFITTQHEQAAAYLAFGYAKSSGKPGVFTVVPGPGRAQRQRGAEASPWPFLHRYR